MEKERDLMTNKCEALLEQLKSNNIDVDQSNFKTEESLFQQQLHAVQSKLAFVQSELDTKIKEVRERDTKLAQLSVTIDRNERLLKQLVDEKLKMEKNDPIEKLDSPKL